jgi:choline dehydrogenase-like flavoprotein
MAPATDVCVIGSGPAGAAAAWALVRRGRTVTILERGRYQFDPDAALGAAPPPWDGLADVGGSVRPILPALVGGGGEINGAVAHRFLPEDFALASRHWQVPDAAIADWPFGYDALEPYYAQAEALHGVSGTDAGARHPPPRSQPYPHAPVVLDCDVTRRLETACAQAGLHVRPTSVAILSRDADARRACVQCGFCAGYPCHYGAKGRPTVTSLREAVATGRCDVVPQVTAHRLILDGARAVGVEYVDAVGRRARLDATTFVIAAGAIFTPRLLLASRSVAFPDGLGNHADLVGRFLCAHPCPRTVGVFDRAVFPANSHFAVRTIDDLYLPPAPIWKGGLLQLHLFGPVVGSRATTYAAPGTFAVADTVGTRVGIYYCTDAVPLARNRVTLSPLLDRLGAAVPRIDHAFHPLDVASAQLGMRTATTLLRAMRATEVIDDGRWMSELGGGFHFSGTTRAGHDPGASVVDAGGRVHGCANVYVADASVFPTSGGANPMLTVIANALRTAAGIDP